MEPAIAASRIDVVQQTPGLRRGLYWVSGATDAMKLHRKIDEAAGRADLEARAQELRNRLAELEAE